LAEFGIVNFCDISKESSLLKKRKSEKIFQFSKRQETEQSSSSEYRRDNEGKPDMKTENVDKNKPDNLRPAENEEEIKLEGEKVLEEKMKETVLCEIYPEEMEIKEVNYEVCIELNIIEQVKFGVINEEIVTDDAIFKVCIVEIVLKEAKLEGKEATNDFEDEISLEVKTESNNENLTEAEIEKCIPKDVVPDKRLESLETKFTEKDRKYNESRSDNRIPRVDSDSLLRRTKFEECKEIENISTFNNDNENENHSELVGPLQECRIETTANIDHQDVGMINKTERLAVMITKDKAKSQKEESYERKSEINEPIRSLVKISGIDTSEVCSTEKFQVCIPEGIPTVKLNPRDLNDIQNCKIVCKNVSHSYIEEDIAVSVTNDYSSSKLQKEFRRCQMQSTEQNRNVVRAVIAIGIFTALAILFSTFIVVRTDDTV